MRPSLMATAILCSTLGIARIAAAQSGALDPTFGIENGLTATTLAGDLRGTSVTAMPDGGWVVSGRQILPVGAKKRIVPLLARFRADGSVDTNFGTAGVVLSSFNYIGADSFTKNTVLRDNAHLYQVVADDRYIRVLAYSANGQPQVSYGDGGMATIDTKSFFVHPFIGAVLQGGRVLLASTGNPTESFSTQFMLVRLTPSGQPDVTFGVDGKRFHQLPGKTVSVFTDLTLTGGSIVAAGRTRGNAPDYDMVVARFSADGEPDTAFDGDGFQVIELATVDFGRRVVVQRDRKIVVAGASCSSPTGLDCAMTAVRLLPNGSLDSGFGTLGTVTVVGVPSPALDGIASDAQGRTLLVGQDANSNGFIARLTGSGQLDGTFGANGIVLQPYGGSAGRVGAVMLTTITDGISAALRLITVGDRTPLGGVSEVVIARHLYE